ncbi:tetratricopeptide repeat protein [Fulvivirgaceae bacterium LMO-SS25]
MTKKTEKPIVRPYSENEWEFIYPSSIDNEFVHNEYWNAVELLDYQDKVAEQTFKKLISKHPYFIDAYNHLSIAYRNQKMTFESLLTAEKSYIIGKECLPKEFNFKKHKLIWGCLGNRPFLRACQIYGLECQYHVNFETAKKIYRENLSLNENDNQGIRYLLLEVYFAENDIIEARRLIEKYSNDFSIEFKFGDVAIEVLDGNLEEADKKLIEAIQTNKYFVDEIVKDKHIQPPPYRILGEPYFDAGIPIGSIQQAYDHWKRNKKLYSNKKIKEYFKRKKASV